MQNELNDIIGSFGFIMTPKPILEKYGHECAVLLGELISEYIYWRNLGKLTQDGYFYSSVDHMKQKTQIGKRGQLRAIATLSELGIISETIRGTPPTRHFRIDTENLISVLNQAVQTGPFNQRDMGHLNGTNRATNKEVINITDEELLLDRAREENRKSVSGNDNYSSQTLTEGESNPSPGCVEPPPYQKTSNTRIHQSCSNISKTLVTYNDQMEVRNLCQHYFVHSPQDGEIDLLDSGIKNCCKEAVLYAIEETARHGITKTPYNYIGKIIESMIAAGVRDAQGVEAYKAAHETGTVNKAPARKGKTLDELLAEAEAEEKTSQQPQARTAIELEEARRLLSILNTVS